MPINPNTKNLECQDFLSYLKSQPQELVKKLYNFPTVCLALYRELPEIARQFVIRVVFVEQPVPQAVVSSWASQHFAKEHASATNILKDLNLWRVAAIPGGLPGWELCSTFKKHLKIALLGGGRPWSMISSFDGDTKQKDAIFLDHYAMSRWKCVLHYMVGAGFSNKGSEIEGISPDAVRILLHANLMKRDDRGGNPTITRKGFQFLLLDTNAQVWYFMLQYLDTCEDRGLNLPECLSMLFQLSYATFGRNYSSEGLGPLMLTFLQHLREFGLVYQRKRREGRFYPTRLALNINKNSTVPSIEENQCETFQGSGYIIVETNYRVYAYTDSNLQIALLALFTELLYRFPNFIVGVLTRDSVRQALRGGITADQIVSYLEQCAHPNMIAHVPVSGFTNNSSLPPTVVDQIKLWENERNRFTYTEGVVYNQFLSQADFSTLRNYAQSINVLVWQNERNRNMVVTKNGHDDVKKFWKRYSKGGS